MSDNDPRYWSKVDQRGPDGCWPWLAAKTSTGYGNYGKAKGVNVLAHRHAYELTRGPIPEGLVIDHLCRTRICCNPAHMEVVTNEENLRRGAGYGLANGMRDTCINGHPYTPENTYQPPVGARRCRECARIRDRQPARRSSVRRNGRKVAA